MFIIFSQQILRDRLLLMGKKIMLILSLYDPTSTTASWLN